jgi:DNA-binding transcriptional regulator YhcF (GntR family)
MIKINEKNRIPKYKQIVRTIQNNIKNGTFKQGDKLPSINKLKNDLDVARDTVIKAYKELVTMGVISSMPGKGYYVSKAVHEIEHHVFLLFDLFLPYKETIYNSFLDNIGEDSIVDIYFHHYNNELYKKLIREAIGQYTDYVIMPLPNDQREWFDDHLGEHNTYILDLGLEQYGKHYPSVCQNFKKQWYEGLSAAVDRIKKYDRLVLVEYRSPLSKYSAPHDREMEAGFLKFCKEKGVEWRIIEHEEDLKIRKNECYMISNDDDLVQMVKQARANNFKLGQDVGIISHNETPLKSIVCRNGVATITTDFEAMGRNMAEMINSAKKEHIENPSTIILRDSI